MTACSLAEPPEPPKPLPAGDEGPGVGTAPEPGRATPLPDGELDPGEYSASVAPTPTAAASTATARWLSILPPRRLGGGGGGKPYPPPYPGPAGESLYT
jgi:hypothetical protein